MKKPRPHIPIKVRLRVAEAQLLALGFTWDPRKPAPTTAGERLKDALEALGDLFGCTVADLRLDHEPQLALRPYNPRIADKAARYTPNANDPRYLNYRPQGRQFANSHSVKSDVRGDHGQYSDTVLRKRARKIEARLAGKTKRKAKIPARVNPWPTGRKFPTRRT